MVVQQGQLGSTDTTIDMESFYSDDVVDIFDDVDRILHNATQFVRLVLQRPQAVTANSASNAGGPDLLADAPHYIDGQFSPNPVPDVDILRVGFASTQLVPTTKIAVYSTQPIVDQSNWEIATSSDGTDAQFDLANFKATGVSVAESTLNDSQTGGNGTQFKYTVTFTAPAIGGLRYWRVFHKNTSDAFDDVTEVEIVEPLTPTISYFDTNGDFANSRSFSQSNILDAVYDNVNEVFYTIRFNIGSPGTSTITLDDDFGDGDAGTASGTNNFNPGRWTESTNNTAFLRLSDALAYNVAAGKGQLETTYTLADFSVRLEINPQVLTTEDMWLAMRALDTSNNVIVQEGVGLETSPTNSGVYFATSVENFVDAVGNCSLRELRPLWHNAVSGTDSMSVIYNGADWTVTGTTGVFADAQTGVLYDESVDSTTPVEFLISCTATPITGEKFTFDVITDNVKREPLATGTLGLLRTGSNLTTEQVFTSPKAISSDAVTIELFGNTDGSINISADNYQALVGSGTFSSVAVFTVERTDDDGNLVAGNPTVIEAFDIIGDPSLTYNDFLDGRVQIAATSSGSGGGSIYIKKDNALYKYPNNVSLGTETTGSLSATQESVGQIAKDGTHSFAWSHKSSINGAPFLSYIEYDPILNIVHLKTLDKDTLLDTTSTKEILLDISGYSTSQEFRTFYNQGDFDTLYYVDASTNLRGWNIDDRISAFMAVNAEDTTLPAGTAQQTFVNADVINAWGEVSVGKTVTFSVTGDGAVTPSSDTTDGAGRATTQFSVGSTVGVSTITATVTEA